MHNYERIAFFDLAVNGIKAWFCNIGYNALFQMNLLTGEVELIDFLPDNKINGRELYSPIAYFQNKLYIAPRNGKYFLIYDLSLRSFITLEMDLGKYGEENNFNLFNHIEEIKGKIYLFPGRFHSIIEFDPITQSVSYIDEWYDELSKNFLREENNKIIFHNIHISAEGICILPCWRSYEIIVINVCDKKYKVLNNSLYQKKPLSDAIIMDNGVLLSYKDDSGIWKDNGKVVLAKSDLQCDYDGGFFFCIYSDWLYMIPLFGENLLRYNFKLKLREVIYKFSKRKVKENEWIPYEINTLCHKVIFEKYLVICPVFESELILVELETGKVYKLHYRMSVQDKRRIEQYFYELELYEVVREQEDFTLNTFLSVLKGYKK